MERRGMINQQWEYGHLGAVEERRAWEIQKIGSLELSKDLHLDNPLITSLLSTWWRRHTVESRDHWTEAARTGLQYSVLI